MPTILNPTPTQGTGTPFGAVPGALGLPDPFGDLSKVAPGLGGVNKNLLTNLTSNSLGIISPGTRNALQLAAAQRGVAGGMGPNSGLSTNDLFGNIAGFSEGLQKQAVQDYSSLIPTISGTQTVNPALQTEIANRNSINAAAPSPQAAASYAKQLFDEYAAKVRGPAGGISFGPQPYTPAPLNFGSPAGGTAPDTRGINYGGTTYYGGATPGAGGATGITSLAGDVGAGGVPINTGSNPVTGTSNFDPFGGFGSFFAPTGGNDLAGQGYGASEAATEQTQPGPGQSGYVYMGANPDKPAGQTFDDAFAELFGV